MSVVEDFQGRMGESRTTTMPPVTADNCVVGFDLVAPDGHFAAHYHAHDQLAWSRGGGMRVRIEDAQWRVTTEQFVWIPAHAQHEMWIDGAESLISLYTDPALRPLGVRWQRALVLPVDPVAGAVLRHLCERERSLARRQAAFALVRDVLQDTPESTDALVLPAHPAARAVAEALTVHPGSDVPLEEWARRFGVSSKTLLRGFTAGTGLTFAQWRLRARMYAAARLLSEGRTVQDVAVEIGYATPTGFIKAYRGVFGSTPGAHSGSDKRSGGERSIYYHQ